METKSHSGIKDEPITTFDADTLGLEDHAKVLSNFIASCDTPMTIAIQGDWGSGKTSMMELIKGKLCCSGPDTPETRAGQIHPIWFNTWQYSQFDLQNSLSLSLLSSFLDQLSKVAKENDKLKTVKNNIKQLGFLALKAGIKNTTGIDADDLLQEKDTDPAKFLSSLREQIQNIVESVTNDHTNEIKRFVVFIDDIDRLVLLKAVELLESLKLFLDVPKCVFVLACDYKIVVQGLREKFNVGEGEVNGRSFFDKIIQVPYNIPMHLYDIDNYIRGLLETISVTPTNRELSKYKRLLLNSVGLNPRSYKRLLNSFLLLRMINQESQDPEALETHESKKIVEDHEEDLLRFSVLCLQTAYEDEFRLMLDLGEELNGAWFENMKKKEKLDEFYATIQKRSLNETITDHRKSSFSAFLEVFFDAIQLDSDENDEILSEQEAEVLRSIMNSSGIIGVSENDTHNASQPKEEFATNLINKLKTKSMSGQLYPDEYEIDWKTSHTGTRLSVWVETLPPLSGYLSPHSCGILT